MEYGMGRGVGVTGVCVGDGAAVRVTTGEGDAGFVGVGPGLFGVWVVIAGFTGVEVLITIEVMVGTAGSTLAPPPGRYNPQADSNSKLKITTNITQGQKASSHFLCMLPSI